MPHIENLTYFIRNVRTYIFTFYTRCIFRLSLFSYPFWVWLSMNFVEIRRVFVRHLKRVVSDVAIESRDGSISTTNSILFELSGFFLFNLLLSVWYIFLLFLTRMFRGRLVFQATFIRNRILFLYYCNVVFVVSPHKSREVHLEMGIKSNMVWMSCRRCEQTLIFINIVLFLLCGNFFGRFLNGSVTYIYGWYVMIQNKTKYETWYGLNCFYNYLHIFRLNIAGSKN